MSYGAGKRQLSINFETNTRGKQFALRITSHVHVVLSKKVMLKICSHANAHCIMKILRGSLTETRYAWPTVHLNQSTEHPLQITSETTYKSNEVTYMSDKLGLHRISNPDPEEHAVSLHRELS
jgi:hypothetical protein